MRALALAVLMAMPALAQDALPADAPVSTPKHDVCLNETDQILLAKRLTALQAENAHLRQTVSGGIPVWVVVVGGVVVAGAAAAAGYGIARATR